MNLARHLSVLWRFRGVTALGILLGIALAVLAAYKVPEMQRRGTETWAVKSDIFVTQPGFPWGRVTLPSQNQTTVLPQANGSATPDPQSDKTLQFADPSRFSNLALLYSVIAYSDQVRAKLPGHPSTAQIQATPIDATGNGTVFLPIIRITTQDLTREGARRLNVATVAGLKSLLETEQRQADIPQNERVQLNILNNPGTPALVKGRSLTPSILAFMLCFVLAVAVAHILEGIRPRPEWAEVPEDDDHAAERMAAVAPASPVAAVQPGSPVSAVPPPPAPTSNWAAGTSVRAAVTGDESALADERAGARRRIFR